MISKMVLEEDLIQFSEPEDDDVFAPQRPLSSAFLLGIDWKTSKTSQGLLDWSPYNINNNQDQFIQPTSSPPLLSSCCNPSSPCTSRGTPSTLSSMLSGFFDDDFAVNSVFGATNDHYAIPKMASFFNSEHQLSTAPPVQVKGVIKKPTSNTTNNNKQQPVNIGRLHVSNIPFRYRREHLYKLFSQYGRLTDAEIIFNERGSKGFGFVSFDLPRDAEKAKQAFHLATIEGRQIEVNYATPRPRHSRGCTKIS